jgi:hypothetical protein
MEKKSSRSPQEAYINTEAHTQAFLKDRDKACSDNRNKPQNYAQTDQYQPGWTH